jgi:hypothetical protein
MPNNVTPNPTDRKTVRFGVRCGDFILVYERVVEKVQPAQVEGTSHKQLEKGGIDIYV